MDDKMNKLQMGALLHDIGKLVRRSTQMKYNLSHVKAGEKYIKKYIKDEEILDMIKYHHYEELQKADIEKDSLAYIVYEADNIASGVDRIKRESNEKGIEKSPLNSIFNSIDRNSNTIKKSFDRSMTYNEDSFNIPKENILKIEGEEYTSILNVFEREMNQMKDNVSLERLMIIFEEISQYVPSSSYVDYPDVSYFDHVKLTTALAACMYMYDIENNINDYKKEYKENNKRSRLKKKFLIVSGEFTGIQDFIYNITSKSAMKSLRGRSLYLELFIEHIIDDILSELGLSRANLLYSGGCKFYMILPNIEKSKHVLDRYKEIINYFLLQELGTKIYYEVAYTETNVYELGNGFGEKIKNKNILSEIFRRLSSKASRGKLQRYSKIQLEKLFDENSILNNKNQWDNTKECGICRKNEVNEILAKNRLDDDTCICNSCKSYIEIGKQVSMLYNIKDRFLVEFNEEVDGSIFYLPSYSDVDRKYVYLKIENEETIKGLMKEDNNKIKRYYSINNYYSKDKLCKNIWIGNYNPKTENDINGKKNLIEFRELVERSKGIKRLAVLRADIDNLGNIFQYGFEDRDERGNLLENGYKYITLSKSVVLSRYLSDFFKRNINIILERNKNISRNEIFNKYCDVIKEGESQARNIVLVYSGGDDIFAIGTWDDIIEFSVDLRQALKDFSGDKITISAGIGFFSDGYPVYNMARITEELETLAKSYRKTENDIPTKNSVALFGKNVSVNHILNSNTENIDKYSLEYKMNHVYSWDDFIDKVLGEKYKFIKDTTSTKEGEDLEKVFIGKSKWYKMMDLINLRLIGDNNLDIARFAYILARINSTKENKGNYNEIKKKLLSWMKNEEDARELLTAINIRIYELRGE